MSDIGSNMRLDALLADLPAPPVPAGLTERVVAAAMAARQEPRAARARRAAGPRRDRRGRWLRRPLLIGIGAFGLALSGAVAATLAGVPIPARIAAVFSQAFVGEEKAEPKAKPPRRATPPRPARAPPGAVSAEPPAPPALEPDRMARRAALARRLVVARNIVAQRRAAGLPTPVADRIERRARLWRAATPAQRTRWIEARRERLRQRIEARGVIRRDRDVPTADRAREAAMVPRIAHPIRRPEGAAAPGPTTRVYGPIDDRAGAGRPRSEDFARRQWLRDRYGEPLAGRRGAIRARPTGPNVRRPVPTRPRRR